MANTILLKRGNKAKVEELTLLPGELAVTLDTQELYVGDADGVVRQIKGGSETVATSASKLATPVNIRLAGDVTGQTSFDGSKDVTIKTSLSTQLDTAIGTLGTTVAGLTEEMKDVVKKEEGKGLSSNDFTTAEKEKLASLENYDDTTIKSDIQEAINAANAAQSDVDSLETVVSGKADKADTYTKTEVDAKLTSIYKYKGSVASKAALPTTDKTVGDVYNLEDTGMNVAWNGTDWDDLGSTVDLSGYLTIENAGTTYATITTVNGKADKSTTYTKTEVDDLVGAKADTSTTLDGYGITNAYTKSEVDGKLDLKANAADVTTSLASKLGTTDVIDGGTF